ncbi:M50 family metallopeptidase [Virgibacillus sp. NKC19-16]|uniref:M50 family metallopeptidase n=1 Tax=Virgibacillus salidurans TaxID=2831673 RepID=UPI001F1EA12D|nr:M50 family metallopeptidase [Virgibacillus sp. NKC19-16]UJL48266.1 M50 family metallopeptidase [Virgibacillus sp. NKC19-16]
MRLNYLPKIHVHPVLMVFLIIAFVTGTFMELAIILAIVLFHELGHYIVASIFKWRIQGIMLWVFGGVMDTEEHGNRPIREEALVTIAGPFQHVIIYLILFFLASADLVPASVLELIFYYNTVILIFNLLPIWPLDGGKLLFLGLSAFSPYKKAYQSVIIFSMVISLFVLVLQLIFFPFTLSAFFIMIFLFMENRSEWNKRYYVFMRFLLKRYEGNTAVNAVRPIVVPHEATLMDVFGHFRREKKHPIYITYPDNGRRAVDENDCLLLFFHEKQYNKTIGEAVSYIP